FEEFAAFTIGHETLLVARSVASAVCANLCPKRPLARLPPLQWLHANDCSVTADPIRLRAPGGSAPSHIAPGRGNGAETESRHHAGAAGCAGGARGRARG